MSKPIKISCCMLAMLLGLSADVRAQFLGGFFNQKATQRKYMIEQIALYKLYLGYVKKGYDITKDGISTVNQIRSGELDLHQAYYTSLKNVSPAIKRQPQVKASMEYCANARKVLGNNRDMVRSSSLFSAQEKTYITQIATTVNVDIDRIIGELELVITPGRLQLTDDERMNRILAILTEAKTVYEFSIRFCDDIKLVSIERKRTLREVETARKLYQLP